VAKFYVKMRNFSHSLSHSLLVTWPFIDVCNVVSWFWRAYHFFLTMNNKGGNFGWNTSKRSHFISLQNLLMPACAVVASHSFIVALFAYHDVMLTCWKITFFVTYVYYFFLMSKPLFFIVLVLLLAQIEEPRCTCIVACAGWGVIWRTTREMVRR